MSVSVADRFWAKVDKSGDCWLWTAGCSGDGYGAFKDGGRKVGAHRWAWAESNGPIPPGQDVLHSCDTPKCVRPSHLFLGTVVENQRDMVDKGRSLFGERNNKAKLTTATVTEIRSLAAEGVQTMDLARRFGVGRIAIRRIVRRVTWSHAA